MRRLVCLVCLLSLTSRSAAADEERLRPKRLWHFAYLPAAYFGLTLPGHELSHAAVAELTDGVSVIDITPYPHNEDGRLIWGSVRLRCYDAAVVAPCGDTAAMGLIALAPSIVDVTVFGASDLLLSTGAIDPDSLSGGVVYVIGMAASWLDFALNTFSNGKGSDHDIVARGFGMTSAQVAFVSDLLLVIGGWRLIVDGRKVLYDRVERPPAGSTALLTPHFRQGEFGLMLVGTW